MHFLKVTGLASCKENYGIVIAFMQYQHPLNKQQNKLFH